MATDLKFSGSYSPSNPANLTFGASQTYGGFCSTHFGTPSTIAAAIAAGFSATTFGAPATIGSGSGDILLILHGENANGSYVITDTSPAATNVTNYGSGVTNSTDTALFGASSLKVLGTTGRKLTLPSSGYSSAGQSWTFEAAINCASYTARKNLFDTNESAGTTGFTIYINGSGQLALVQNEAGATPLTFGAVGTALTANAWQRVAVTWDGSALRFYVNGALTATHTSGFLNPWSTNEGPCLFANRNGTPSSCLDGYADEVRYTRGVARYTTSAYTLDAGPFPEISIETGTSSTAFGTPSSPVLSTATGFLATTFGTPIAPAVAGATGFLASQFGTPSSPVIASVDGFSSTAFGIPSSPVLATADGFDSTAFGTPSSPVIATASGFCGTTFGLPSGDETVIAVGFSATRFGTPEVFVYSVDPLSPVVFGDLTLLPVAESLQAVSFGDDAHIIFTVTTLKAVHFDKPVGPNNALRRVNASASVTRFGYPSAFHYTP